MGLSDNEIQQYMSELAAPTPGSELLFNEKPAADGSQRTFANVYKETSLNIDKGDKGDLFESEKSQFYRFGLDLPTKRLSWKGIIRIKPQSVLAPSKDLLKRMKLDLFNMVYPALQAMLAQPQNISILLPSVKQIVKVHDEDVKDWFPEKELMVLGEAAKQPKTPVKDDPKLSVSIKFETLVPAVQTTILEKYMGIKVQDPLIVDQNGQGNHTASIIDDTQHPQIPGSTPAGSPDTAATGGDPFHPMVARDSVSLASTNNNAMRGMQQ